MEENQVLIPDGWTEDSLGSILDYEQPYKYTVDATEYDDRSGIPVLTAGKSFILGYTTEQHNIYKSTPVIIFDDFTTDSKFVDFPFKVKSSAMKFLKPKKPDKFDIKIIFGHLQNLKFRETGGDHKRRWISEFSKLRIVLPPSTEQTQIATILAKVDEAIAQTEQLIAKYTRIRTGLMQDLLTKGIDKHGNIRSEETHEFKDSSLGRIPKEWNVSSVDSLCSEIVVGIVIRPTQYYKESGIPMLRSQNIKVDGVVMKDLVYMSEIDNNKLVKSKLSENDVVSVRTGYPGTTAVISKKIEGCNCIDLVISRPNQSLLNSHFLALFINSELGRKQILNHQSGIAQQHFNVGQMKDLMIVKIAISEQLRILDNISSINIQIADFGSSLSKLQSLKTGLMQDLLSGKVRVNHLIKETLTV
jgi:type I restriction enzyme S subunit